jgi:hypothetical protein
MPDCLNKGSAILLLALVACSSKTAEPMKPQDAARWLHEACGVTFSQEPVVLTHARSSTGVTVTVVLPGPEEASALRTLRNNRSLHSRGQSATRYSYESYPDATATIACELDTSLHILYFSYAK